MYFSVFNFVSFCYNWPPMVRSNYILHLFEMTMRTKPEFQNCQMKKINVKCVSGWENDVMLHVLDVIEAVWLPCGGDLFSLQIKLSFFWWGSTFWEAWRSKTFIFAEGAKLVFVIVVVLLWHWPVEVGLLYASCMAWRFFFFQSELSGEDAFMLWELPTAVVI